jgi:hypothetical protein
MQGIFLDGLEQFSDKLLSDLAGNAFASPCCMAGTIAIMRVLGNA